MMPSTLALPKSTVDLINTVPTARRHPGLQLDKFSVADEQTEQKKALEKSSLLLVTRPCSTLYCSDATPDCPPYREYAGGAARPLVPSPCTVPRVGARKRWNPSR